MTSAVDGDANCEVVLEALSDQGQLPFNLTKDLSDLKIGFGQLKEKPELANDQPFDIKMVDYLNNYVADFNAGLKNGTLTAAQQILLSDLNEDLKVNGLLTILTDGPISNPNDQQSIGPFLAALASDDHKVDWICIINAAIDAVLGTPSKA